MAKVQTNYGPVKGIAQETADGKKYTAFMGIPYAKQPTGELRYRDPQPLEPWKTDLDATKEGPMGYQVNIFNISADKTQKTVGADACLVLNVYTPNVTGKLPVFVWIHGGGFAHGSGGRDFYGPDYLVEQDIVVVSIQYRLGVVGFLSFKDETLGIPGNAGLKDQSMALKWVKDNVAHFGGDAGNITLAGESAGSASVHYQMISPMSKGLFNRAILESGTAFNPWANMPSDENYEHDLAKALGWNGEGGDKEAFKVISSTEISKVMITASDLLSAPEQKLFGSAQICPFLPRVEPYVGQMCFLPKAIVELSRNPWSKDLDIIIGGNKDEALLFEKLFKEHAPLLEKNFKLVIPTELRKTLNESEKTAAASALKNVYFSNTEIKFDSTQKFLDIVGDLHFWHGIHRFIRQRQLGGGKSYFYFLSSSTDPSLFGYTFLRNLCEVPHLEGCCHADELLLIFKAAFSTKPSPRNQIYPVFRKFFGSYVSFIKTGNPNNDILGAKWNAVGDHSNKEVFKCLRFNDNSVEMVAGPYEERLSVWDSLYDSLMLV